MHTPPDTPAPGQPAPPARPLQRRPLRAVVDRWLLGLAGLAGLVEAGQAGPLNTPLADPTRPPGAAAAGPASGAQNRSAKAAATRRASDNAAADEPIAALSNTLLQAIQTSSHAPPVAMVDGQLVRVGDTVAGRTVLAIDSQGLLLRGAAGHERLWLLTDSPKQTAGSITTTRSATYVPTPSAPDAASDADPAQRAQRPGTPGTAAGNAAALSLIGRTQP